MGMPERKLADVNGIKISYRQAGTGPDLVLLHGLAGNARTWEKQFDSLADCYRVTAWDAPGYGLSDLVEIDAEVYADILNEFIKSMGMDKIILLGHSMGGIIAGNFSGRYPQHVRGLILSCTLLGRKQSKGQSLDPKYVARLKQLDDLSPIEYGRIRAKTMTAPGCDPVILEHFAGIAAETRREGLAAAIRVVSEADNEITFANLNMPVLVIAGALDQTVTRESTEDMIAAIPDTVPELTVNNLPGVAHAPYMEDSETYNTVIQEFFSTLR